MPSQWLEGAPNAEQLEAFRTDPRHWNRGVIYSCAFDPRLMVRDRLGLGWTLNMAHPRASMVIWSILAGTSSLAAFLLWLAARAT